jgi:hypothetical protein
VLEGFPRLVPLSSIDSRVQNAFTISGPPPSDQVVEVAPGVFTPYNPAVPNLESYLDVPNDGDCVVRHEYFPNTGGACWNGVACVDMKGVGVAVAMVGVAVTAFAAPAVASAGDDAANALKKQFEYYSKGQFGRLYALLHPAQKEIVSKADYLRCATSLPSFELGGVDVLETYRERIDIPGTDLVVPSQAITVKITVQSGVGKETDTDTSHEVKVDKKWRWIVNDPDGFSNGGCPADFGGTSSATDPTGKNAGVTITLAEFEQLQPGIIYEEVVAMIGGEGTVQSQTESGSFSSASYEWHRDRSHPVVNRPSKRLR